MIIWAYNYLRGYVLVRFEGTRPEIILSKLGKANIKVWKLRYTNGYIYGKMCAKDFLKLRSLRYGTDIKIKIMGKRGLPFFARRYRHRSGLVVGAVIFFLILKFLSCFIWVINVEGNKTVKTTDILKTLRDIGVYEKMPKNEIDSKVMAQKLLLNRNDLSWSALNIEGCVLNVNISEIKETAKIDKSLPTNLVAANDGVITKIDAVSGDVLVKIGQNVHKGEVLVSGIIESMTSTVFVRSEAIVTAQVEKTYTKSLDFTQRNKVYTGKKTEHNALQVLGINFPLYLAKNKLSADIEYRCCQLQILGNKTPVKLYSAELKHYNDQKFSYTEDELKKQLLKELNDNLEIKGINGYIPVGTDYRKYDDRVEIIHR